MVFKKIDYLIAPLTEYPVSLEETDAVNILAPVETSALDPSKKIVKIHWLDDGGDAYGVWYLKQREFGFDEYGRAELLGDEDDGAASVGTIIGTSVDFTVDGSTLVKIQNNGVDKSLFYHNGGFEFCISDTGGSFKFYPIEELVTVLDLASTETLIEIPAGTEAIITCRVVTDIPGVSDFSLGDADDASRWGAELSPLAGSTNKSVAQINGFVYFTDATTIVITPDTTPSAATGEVRIFGVYREINPPTS